MTLDGDHDADEDTHARHLRAHVSLSLENCQKKKSRLRGEYSHVDSIIDE